MSTAVVLDKELVKRTMAVSDVRKRSSLRREALQYIVQREAARRLVLLGGSDPETTAAPRWRAPH
jgi:hypothetical protein